MCFLFGHKISDTTDSGYATCDRCSAHEYYDREFTNKWDNAGWLLYPYYKILRVINNLKNKKIEYYDSDLPF